MRTPSTQYVEDRLATSRTIKAMAADLQAIEDAVLRLTERVARLDSERAITESLERD